MKSRDQLYSRKIEPISPFVFNETVAAVFNDMIRRSVPGYGELLSHLGVWAAAHVQPGTRCYDLGCSLGAASWAMQSAIDQPGVEIVAVDSSPAMVEKARAHLQKSRVPATVHCADIREVVIENASVVVLNFTLQFIARAQRARLLHTIYRGLRPGGICLLSEKVALSDSGSQRWFAQVHEAFKKAQGYSELEIAQKRSALEKVLVPETVAQHRRRLQRCGFARAQVWFQCYQFVSLVAWKGM